MISTGGLLARACVQPSVLSAACTASLGLLKRLGPLAGQGLSRAAYGQPAYAAQLPQDESTEPQPIPEVIAALQACLCIFFYRGTTQLRLIEYYACVVYHGSSLACLKQSSISACRVIDLVRAADVYKCTDRLPVCASVPVWVVVM